MRQAIFVCLTFICCLLIFAAKNEVYAVEAPAIAQKPNIILVFIDDMGWGDFSCFGNSAVETENIDRLAREGVRFEPFYVNVWPDYIRDDEQLRDNTLILVCSDNGPELGAGSAGPFRGFKTHLFEGGIRSPLIAWGPGLIKHRHTRQHNKSSVFSAIDLVPTLLAIADFTPTAGIRFDGESLPGKTGLIASSTTPKKLRIDYRLDDRHSKIIETYHEKDTIIGKRFVHSQN